MTWRGRVTGAQTWEELDVILTQADAAYRVGKLTRAQVEMLTEMAVERARRVGAKAPVKRECVVEWPMYGEAA